MFRASLAIRRRLVQKEVFPAGRVSLDGCNDAGRCHGTLTAEYLLRSGGQIIHISPTSLAAALVLIACCEDASGQESRLDWFGDFRLRLEQDWDSLQGDGTSRDDRLRLRFRLRGGFDYDFTDHWRARVQARSGPRLSQQSPHVTIKDFDGGPSGPYDVNLDHWYVEYTNGGFVAWVGRNILSFLHQDDLFIFDNVTYAGAGGSYTKDFGDHSWYLSFNYVALPVGMREFVGNGTIGQVAYQKRFGESALTVGVGYMLTNADPDDPAGETLLTGNNARDIVAEVESRGGALKAGQRLRSRWRKTSS